MKDKRNEMKIPGNPGKGHNETLEIANSVEHTKAANDVRQVHVPKNGGTCARIRSQFAIDFNMARRS
jgi:hypothetical protein